MPSSGWRRGRDEVVRVPGPGGGYRPRARGADRGARRAGGPGAGGRIDEVRPGPWGVTLTSPPHRIDWELEAGVGRGEAGRSGWPRSWACSGCPAGAGRSLDDSATPWGGNIDCKELVAGTTLFLPIPVDGALFSAGDGHAAQGDGEVSWTAIEAPVEAQLTLDVRDDLVLDWPFARIEGAWLTFGFDEHLGVAARIAVDGMLDLMERELGLSRADALASRRSSST